MLVRDTATLGLGRGPVWLLYPVSPSGHVPATVREGAPAWAGARGEERGPVSCLIDSCPGGCDVEFSLGAEWALMQGQRGQLCWAAGSGSRGHSRGASGWWLPHPEGSGPVKSSSCPFLHPATPCCPGTPPLHASLLAGRRLPLSCPRHPPGSGPACLLGPQLGASWEPASPLLPHRGIFRHRRAPRPREPTPAPATGERSRPLPQPALFGGESQP